MADRAADRVRRRRRGTAAKHGLTVCRGRWPNMPDELVNVRYMVDDVDEAVAFYTTHFGFTVRTSAAPAFADVVRGNLRLLISGPESSAGRPADPAGGPGGQPDRALPAGRRIAPISSRHGAGQSWHDDDARA